MNIIKRICIYFKRLIKLPFIKKWKKDKKRKEKVPPLFKIRRYFFMTFINGRVNFVTKKELKKINKKARKIERVELRISKEESYERAKQMLEFLKLIHPGNTNDGFLNPIELKFLLRGDGITTSLGGFFSLYNLDSERELDRLSKRIEDSFKFSHCMYFSLYTYDRKKEVKVKIEGPDGKQTFEHKPLNNITRENAVETWVLPMDFDNVSREDYERYRDYFSHLGIQTLSVFTGHGYQLYVLLKKPVKSKNAFEKFTTKLLELGLPVDGSITDPSRVFRMPFSRNCKGYSIEFESYRPNSPVAIETKVIDWTTERYEYKEVMGILDGEIKRMNDVPFSQDKPLNRVPMEKVVNTPEEIQKPLETISEDNTFYQELYKHLDFSNQPLNVQNILKGARKGYRNSCLMYLVPYVNKVLGLTQTEAKETLLIFNKLCSPSLPDEVVVSEYYRISDNYGQYNRGLYTDEMSKEFGREELDTLIKTDFDKIHFDNEVIKQFNKIHHSSIRLYLALKLLEIEQGKEGLSFTKEEIALAAGVSEKTVQRYMRELTKRSLALKVKVANNKGTKDAYKINKYGAYKNGFTQISKLLAKDMIRTLQPSELVLYIVLYSKAKGMNKVNIFTSQEKLALAIGSDQTRISRITDKLKEQGYIRKTTTMSIQNRKKTTYVLRNT